jgi:hypothetical protein
VTSKNESNTRKNYRKAFNFRVVRESNLDIVLQYLDDGEKPLSSVLEELLLSVYLVPAMREAEVIEEDIYLQGLNSIGVLNGILDRLKASVDLVRPAKCRPAFEKFEGVIPPTGRESPARDSDSSSSLAGLNSDTPEHEASENYHSEDYREKAISGVEKMNSMFSIN